MQWRIAHRGACGQYPENTLLAFSKALQMGANALELDVHLCKSGDVVVIHDETLQRTTNGQGAVAEHSYEQLKTLDAGAGETYILC
jgi:glycerophosphoryl diester phosphodiesterase